MRYNSARQMIFDAYLFHRGDSPVASIFDSAKRLEKAVGRNAGARTRSIVAQYNKALATLSNAQRIGEGEAQAAKAVRLLERQLSSIRLALADSPKSSNEGYIRDNDWNIVSGLEAGAVLSVVDALPRHQRALALYCYGPLERRERDALAEVVQLALHHQLLAGGTKLPGQGKGLPTAESLDALYWLCLAAVYHYSETQAGRPGLSTPQMIQRWMYEEHGLVIEVRRWSSKKDGHQWAEPWHAALKLMIEWEQDALERLETLITLRRAA
ncbi:hypothetical protein [Halomonas sp. WWR20]